MNRILPLVCLLLVNLGTYGQDKYTVKVTEHRLSSVSKQFWGTNFLFWIEDDRSLSGGEIEKSLKALPCGVLRYPGGTVADNFHWQTNLLDNSFMFPFEDGQDQSDFDEFMTFCSRVGAEPMLVVNTQSWFLKGDVEGGAREAAMWVRYCKDKGYRVKYWEIGNETYWHPVMTAKEYGELFNTYSAAMKKEDPYILLGANCHWDVNASGTKERVQKDLWQDIKSRYLAISCRKDYEELKSYIDRNTTKPYSNGKDKWLYDLLTTCGENIDMLSIHWYYADKQISFMEEKFCQIKTLSRQICPQKDYLLCISEYNCITQNPEMRMLGLAESLGYLLNVGAEVGCIWPLRIQGAWGPKNNKSVLRFNDKKEQYPYQILQLFQESFRGEMLECSFPEGLPIFVSDNSDSYGVAVSGKSLLNPSKLNLVFPVDMLGEILNIRILHPDSESMRFVEEEYNNSVVIRKNKLILIVEPMSHVLITVSKRSSV